MEFTERGYLKHISTTFNNEIEGIRRDFLDMGCLVEKQLQRAILALINGDRKIAQSVINSDEKVNTMELDIDERCASFLALYQPTASDLRFIIAVSKAINELERIGDESSKIAQISIDLDHKAPRGYREIQKLSEHVYSMIHTSLTAFSNLDTHVALSVVKSDKQVDSEYSAATQQLMTFMTNVPDSISSVMNIIWVLRALERIGDHTTNIAEDVIYLVKGMDVRHLPYREIEKKIA